ncbi:MAG: hypothetical protein WBB45_03565 [Cyclobacteriaceae bacterium]
MKKNHLLTLLLAVTMGLFSACTDTALEEIENPPLEQNVSEAQDDDISPGEDAEFQFAAIKQLERLNAHFANKPYPGYFGGAYIGDDGKLVVWIKGNAKKLKPQMAAILGTDDVVIRRARHSFNYLKRVMNDLNVFKLNPTNAATSANWNAYALMDADNEVIVELDDFNDVKIAEFKRTVMNHPAIRFTKSSGPVIEEVNLQPGCRASDGGFVGSYAFRAKDDISTGMVVSGHQFSFGETLYEGGVPIGICVASRNSGSVDAAYIDVYESGYFPSNLVCVTNSTLSTTTSRPGVGTVVNKRGQKTGRTSGKILSTDATTSNSSGTVFTNLTLADYNSDNGDSGGIVYTYISSTGTLFTVGVHKGSNSNGAYFSKADLALSALGVSRY